MREENTATPLAYIYIFVFVNEVFNIFNAKFPLPRIANWCPSCSEPKYSLEIYLLLQPQNISAVRSKCNKNGSMGHQMKSSKAPNYYYHLFVVGKKKLGGEHAAFLKE